MENVREGSFVIVTTAAGEQVRMRALSGCVPGRDFQVVWVCLPEEWKLAEQLGDGPSGIPWPVEAVRVASEAVDAS